MGGREIRECVSEREEGKKRGVRVKKCGFEHGKREKKQKKIMTTWRRDREKRDRDRRKVGRNLERRRGRVA